MLEDITPIDWEDLALGPGPDPDLDYLYIADTGALLGNREEFAVLRVAEPSVDPDRESRVDEPLTDVETFPVRYPDRGRDNETLLVDPVSGEVLLVHKSWSETGEALVFQVPLDTPDTVATLVPVGAVALMPGEQATAGDVSPAGDAIVLRTYSQVLLFSRPPGTTLTAALANPPCAVPGPDRATGRIRDVRGRRPVAAHGERGCERRSPRAPSTWLTRTARFVADSSLREKQHKCAGDLTTAESRVSPGKYALLAHERARADEARPGKASSDRASSSKGNFRASVARATATKGGGAGVNISLDAW